MTSPATAASSPTDNVTQGSLRTGAGRSLPLSSTEARAFVSGHVARVIVRQRFYNDTTEAIEAIYAFPLPDGASVYRMELRIQDRTVRAVVKEKAEARRDYEEARSQGRSATLLEEDKPALFTLSVANVAPEATIDVELEYQELCAFDDGRFRLVFPMVAPTRYGDGPAPTPGDKTPPPRRATGERAPDVSIEVDLAAIEDITSARSTSHPVEVTPLSTSAARVRLAPSAAIANRDFVLEWKAARAGVRQEAFFERREGELGAFLLTLVPPSSEVEIERRGSGMKALACGNCGGLVTDLSAIREVPGLGPVVPCRYCGAILAPGTERVAKASKPRDVVLLVDRSASMRGALGQIRAAVSAILGALGPSDAAQIIAFDHKRTPFDGDGSRFVPISPELREAADRFLAELTPRGGTELEEALARAAALPTREGRTRLIVLLGDAAVGNEGRLLRRLPAILGASTRLFVLGIGRAVDRRLASRLARVGGGSSDVLPLWGDPSEAISRFAARISQSGPILTDLTLWWDGAGAADVYPKPIPDLYAGQPIHLIGRYSGSGASRAIITGRTAEGAPFRQELAVEAPAVSEMTPGLLRLWARRHVEALASTATDDLAEKNTITSEALALSLTHSIVGPYTSLVAVDSEISVQKLNLRVGRFLIISGPDEGASLRLDRDRLVVGRHSGVNLRLSDAGVSRHHFEVLADPAGFFIRDLDSANGVVIQGKTARQARLTEGMTLQIGSTVLRFMFDPKATFEFLPTTRVVAARSAPDDEEELLERTTSAAMAALEAPEGRAPPAARASLSGLRKGSAPPPPMSPSPMPGRAASYGPASSGPPRSLGPSSAAPPSGFAPPPPETPLPPPALGAPPPRMPKPPAIPAPPAPAPPPLPGRLPPVPHSPSAPPLAMRRSAPPPALSSSALVPQSPIEAPGSEPYPEHELVWLADKIRGELDLVFLVDATGSMGPYIQEVKQRLLELATALRASPLCKSLRMGLVSYRDHPPQDRSYTSRVTPLTSDITTIRSAVMDLSAAGGGDGPEAVTDGLFDVVRLDFRPGSTRAVVWFGDAPPHGVEPEGDAFPGGCPCGNHWYTQAESCREMGITIYSIGCLPGLRNFIGAEGVFRAVARATRGMFLPLREASLLVPLIAGAAASELDKQRLDEHVSAIWAAHTEALLATDEAERARWIASALRAEGVQVREMRAAGEVYEATPLCFRDVEEPDVTGSLDRLRLAGRVAA